MRCAPCASASVRASPSSSNASMPTDAVPGRTTTCVSAIGCARRAGGSCAPPGRSPLSLLGWHTPYHAPRCALLTQEHLGDRRSPLEQTIGTDMVRFRRLAGVEDFAVGVMLHDDAIRVVPVVEDLAAQRMTPDTPGVLVALRCEPLVAKHLRVEVLNLERAMM